MGSIESELRDYYQKAERYRLIDYEEPHVTEPERWLAYTQWRASAEKCRKLLADIERDDAGRPICSPDRPWREEDGTPAVHPNAEEVGEQESGWPSGDRVKMRCPNCGVTWTRELPQ